MTIHRGDCGHIKSHWDNHKKCINCSHCSRESTCSTCSSWSNSVWYLVENVRTYSARKKAMSTRKKSQNPFPQTRGKRNMGALPHMALLAGVRPILMATPWVLVPKGVQVHWPPGNGHRVSHDQPTRQRPIVQWTRRHI